MHRFDATSPDTYFVPSSPSPCRTFLLALTCWGAPTVFARLLPSSNACEMASAYVKAMSVQAQTPRVMG
jgi:hypothetical protein